MRQLTPLNSINDIHSELSRVFDNRYGLAKESVSYAAGHWSPQVDIKEDEKQFTVLADVPGIDPKDVDVTLHNSVLTIKGERSSDTESEGNNFKRRERVRGSFFRQFTLPVTTNESAIRAKATNGVLEIVIPKTAKPEPISITVEEDFSQGTSD
jgi:HSP20 family protein